LLAAEKAGNEFCKNNKLTLFGCDRAPINGLLQHMPSSNLMEMDFFDFSSKNKHDIIVMNPPFVRHHLIDREKRKKYQKIIQGICPVKCSADLWVYFLIKSVMHLKKAGHIGAILPWSFLQSDYARDVRMWLSKNFEKIQVLALSAEYFNDTQERIVLLWLKGYGHSANSIRISFSAHLSDKLNYTALTQAQWMSKKVLHSNNNDIHNIFNDYISKYNFKIFEEYGNVRIGVVTGADHYFILSEESVKKYNFPSKYLIPILNSSKQFTGLFLNGNTPSKKLVTLTHDNSTKFKDYILEGVKSQYHLRAHSLRREPWYSVDQGKIPDAFFPYRAMIIPYMVLNNKDIQCTNSIHRIYFNKSISMTEKKWIQLSLLSIVGQLSIEAQSKVYGNGVLKIEPGSLKNAITYKCSDKSVNVVYNKVSKLISLNQKIDAMRCATEFINEKLNISKELSEKTYEALIELQNRRLER
jgi:hypothetical protein